jgi:hypothetical protein
MKASSWKVERRISYELESCQTEKQRSARHMWGLLNLGWSIGIVFFPDGAKTVTDMPLGAEARGNPIALGYCSLSSCLLIESPYISVAPSPTKSSTSQACKSPASIHFYDTCVSPASLFSCPRNTHARLNLAFHLRPTPPARPPQPSFNPSHRIAQSDVIITGRHLQPASGVNTWAECRTLRA